jgi:hypothetical protein
VFGQLSAQSALAHCQLPRDVFLVVLVPQAASYDALDT